MLVLGEPHLWPTVPYELQTSGYRKLMGESSQSVGVSFQMCAALIPFSGAKTCPTLPGNRTILEMKLLHDGGERRF